MPAAMRPASPRYARREEARVAGHLRQLRLRRHVAHELRVPLRRELPQDPELEPEDREAAHVVEPALEVERGVERHLAVEPDMPGVGVVVRVGVAPVERLLAVEQGRDPEDRLVQPARPERGAVRRLVAERVGGHGEDDAVDEHRRPDPERPQGEPDEAAGEGHQDGPGGEIREPRTVAPTREGLEALALDPDAGRGGVRHDGARGPVPERRLAAGGARRPGCRLDFDRSVHRHLPGHHRP